MDTTYSAELTTPLNRNGVHHHVEELLPELAWRRGESELSNELMLTGTDNHGFRIEFSMHEYEVGGSVRISAPVEHPTADDLIRRVLDEVLPQLAQATPGRGHSGPSPGAPPESESYAVMLARQRAANAGSAPSADPVPLSTVQPSPVSGIDRPSSARPAHLPSRVGQRSAGAELLIDLFHWLPGWGEFEAKIRATSPHLVLDIEYDLSRQPDDGTAVISVVFEWARCYTWYSAPSMLGICSPGGALESEAVWDVGQTDLAMKVQQSPSARTFNRKPRFREYTMWLQDSGIGLNVIAESVRVE